MISIIDKTVAWYRKRGFPYPDLTPHEVWTALEDVRSSRLKIESTALPLLGETTTKRIGTSSAGINAASSFHRHIWESHAIGMSSPLSAFHDPKKLPKAISLSIEYNGRSDAKNVLDKLRVVNGTQMCSNFRPTVAKWIYTTFASERATVLDPSTGYGGRLFGFLASDNCLKYIGVDPSTKTCAGNEEMAAFFDRSQDVRIICKPFEDVSEQELGDVDFAFTSPPYFRKEIYSDENTQSSARYQFYAKWRNRFLRVMIAKVYVALRDGCRFVLNIQDVTVDGRECHLIADAIEDAEGIGFELEDRYEMSFSGFGKGLVKTKCEAVLIFRKTIGSSTTG